MLKNQSALVLQKAYELKPATLSKQSLDAIDSTWNEIQQHRIQEELKGPYIQLKKHVTSLQVSRVLLLASAYTQIQKGMLQDIPTYLTTERSTSLPHVEKKESH